MPDGFRVTPDELEAAGRVALRASDQLADTVDALSTGGDFAGDAVSRTSTGFRDLQADWRRAAGTMAKAVESLGFGLRGAAGVYRDTEEGAAAAFRSG